jgi:hypothetical protein
MITSQSDSSQSNVRILIKVGAEWFAAKGKGVKGSDASVWVFESWKAFQWDGPGTYAKV